VSHTKLLKLQRYKCL